MPCLTRNRGGGPSEHQQGLVSSADPSRLRVSAPTTPARGRRPDSRLAQALELCTPVGQTHSRWSCTGRGSPTCVPISNVRTDLQRAYRSPTYVPNSHGSGSVHALGAGVGPDSRPSAGVGVMFTRWTNAQPLELHGAWISNVGPDLQRTYPTLTAVGRCTPTVDREPRGRAVPSTPVRSRHQKMTRQAIDTPGSEQPSRGHGQCVLRDQPPSAESGAICGRSFGRNRVV
jgi:hypothetical protein